MFLTKLYLCYLQIVFLCFIHITYCQKYSIRTRRRIIITSMHLHLVLSCNIGTCSSENHLEPTLALTTQNELHQTPTSLETIGLLHQFRSEWSKYETALLSKSIFIFDKYFPKPFFEHLWWHFPLVWNPCCSRLTILLGIAAVATGQLVDDFECPDEFAGFYPHLIRYHPTLILSWI